TDRDCSKPLRVAMEFDLPTGVNDELRERLAKEAPHLDRSIEQIKTNNRIAFVGAGVSDGREAYFFIEQIVVGSLDGDDEELRIEGIRLLSVSSAVARELAKIQQQIGSFNTDIKALQSLSSDRRRLEYVI